MKSTEQQWQDLDEIQPHSRAAIRKLHVRNPEDDIDSNLSGWAVLFLASVHGGLQFVGFLVNRIQGSAIQSGLQPLGTNAFSAEIAALMVTLSMTGGSGVKAANIYYDAQSAADVVLGDAWPNSGDSPCLAAKLLGYYVRQKGTALEWCHVKSHNGCPYNDFADVVAKQSAKTGRTFGGDMTSLGEALLERYFRWMWWHDFDRQHPHVLPQHDGEGTTVPIERSQLEADTERATGQIPGIPVGAVGATYVQNGILQLSIVSCNTLSLQSAAQRCLLQGQFATAQVHLVGLQETRRCCDPVETIGQCRAFTSEPVDGREGCQIWLNLQEATGWDREGNPVFWNPIAKIWKAQPRLLIVVAETGGQHFALISAHAPTANADKSVLRTWWKDFEHSVKQLPKQVRIILMIDANARLTAADEVAGIMSAYPDNAATIHFQHTLKELRLSASNMVDCYGKPVITWVSPNGKPARLDYIAATEEIAGGMLTIGNLRHFTDCFDFDHKPLLVKLC